MRLLDQLRGGREARRELAEVRALYDRLRRYTADGPGRASALVERIAGRAFRAGGGGLPPMVEHAVVALVITLLEDDAAFLVPDLDLAGCGTAELWELKALLTRQLGFFESGRKVSLLEDAITRALEAVVDRLPAGLRDNEAEGAGFTVPLYALLRDPAAAIEAILQAILDEELAEAGLVQGLHARLTHNLYQASGIDPDRPESSRKPLLLPTQTRNMSPAGLVPTYLVGTPFMALLQTEVRFEVPLSARFEHTHILGGSGHGKTQLLQHLVLRDLEALKAGKGSVVVIDSQGDLIRNIMHLADVRDMADRVVLIDPDDIEHPPALNLFDFGLNRLDGYAAKDREMLLNGAVALFEYMFGALLGAELTNRQQVIFRFIARLMMVVDGATIHTMREFMESPEATRPYLDRLEPVERHFFTTQFYEGTYNDTRKQILARLWGVLSNRILARMFAHPRNRVNLFEAMNRGSLILVNTAKDLLKQEGTEIMGRFFIAMIAHAAQERASIPEARRRATFVYIDEAQDYFDSSIESLLNQARKYKVGLVLAHQNLDQLDRGLQAAIMASTAIKLAGGVSASDAGVIAREMRAELDFLQSMHKHGDRTEFACFVRNTTPTALRLTVPFGTMESRPRMSAEERAELITLNCSRYSVSAQETVGRVDSLPPVNRFEIGKYEAL